MPLVGFGPVQPPPAAHEVALVEVELAIEILLEPMLGGLADNATVGSAMLPPPPWLLVVWIWMLSQCHVYRSDEFGATPFRSKCLSGL